MAKILLSNTLAGAKQELKPLVKNTVKMYVCGVTPYDLSHIGHGRCYVSFDLLYRLLKYLGYNVDYCRNLTDIDDKILKKAQEKFDDKLRFAEITEPMIKKFHDDMHKLNNLPPNYEPKATETIDEIIAFVKGLIDAGKAYQANGDVYFSIESFSGYGKLSKHKIEDLKAGSRVDVSDIKRNPLDFALWKSEPDGTFWKSPWGWGRPGWHIECSAMSHKYLGKSFDIHGGGQDLAFPHHENEIAQSEGLFGVPMAQFWVHNGFVRIDKEKMSKSLGNIISLEDIFKKYDPMVLRYYLITHHYKAPIEFSFDDLDSAKKAYSRLCKIFSEHECTEQELSGSPGKYEITEKMLEYLTDDLNTPGMLGVLFENLDDIRNDHAKLCAVKGLLQKVLGLHLVPLKEKEVEMTAEIKALVKEREDARAEKDWAKADAIRDKLEAIGVSVKDAKIK